MLSLTVENVEFSSAHFLPNHAGKCRRLHGHNYSLSISVTGPVNNHDGSPECGMIMDFHVLKGMVREVVGEYDHHDLNCTLRNPTAENLLQRIVRDMDVRLPSGFSVSRATLHETRDCAACYERD